MPDHSLGRTMSIHTVTGKVMLYMCDCVPLVSSDVPRLLALSFLHTSDTKQMHTYKHVDSSYRNLY